MKGQTDTDEVRFHKLWQDNKLEVKQQDKKSLDVIKWLAWQAEMKTTWSNKAKDGENRSHVILLCSLRSAVSCSLRKASKGGKRTKTRWSCWGKNQHNKLSHEWNREFQTDTGLFFVCVSVCVFAYNLISRLESGSSFTSTESVEVRS